ncbi:hypothetical protein MTR67_001089, partial [Solanum verrucosum]
LGEIEPDSNFTAEDFFLKSIVYREIFLTTQCVPIIVEQSVLNRRVDTRVDEMVNAELVDEVWQIFIQDAYYTKGIRWSIGVPEMARYLREKKYNGVDESKKMILQASISSINRNTCILICNQLDKIQRLINEKMWSGHHIIATDVFKENRKEVVDEEWRNTVLQ